MYKFLQLLEKIPYRTSFGLSLADLLKSYWYHSRQHHDFCLCGGRIKTYYFHLGFEDVGWEIICTKCGYLFGED